MPCDLQLQTDRGLRRPLSSLKGPTFRLRTYSMFEGRPEIPSHLIMGPIGLLERVPHS
jgi:hypothetical protein